MMEQIILPEGQESFKLNEVCKLANVQPYMLRFWGQEFPQLEAEKSGTGQRTFRKDQVELILEIKHLLFDEGLTIAGARKRLDNGDEGSKPAAVPPPSEEEAPPGDQKEDKPKKKRQSRAKKSPSPKPVAAGSRGQKVDKHPVENVQPLLATLRDVRAELADVVAELKIK
ncbi:MAG: MerR family transcriptional regulator [Acidobacteriota bacterium]